MTASLDGRSSIITGASQGLGYEIAKHYVKAGANVLVCARGDRRLDQAADELRSFADRGQTVLAVAADVSNQDDAARIVETALDQFKELDILVNNAGVYGPKGMLEELAWTEWTEWTRAIEINLYGPVLMSRVVLPHFKERNYGKIIQLSGGGATKPLPRLSAYAASKAAVVRFAETLAEEVREYRIDVNSIAPGPLNTRLLDEILEAGPAKVGHDFFQSSLKQRRDGGTSTSKAAELAVFLGSSESDGITGKLLSAVWDPWESLGARIDELRKSDIYTLRRIVPKDRGALWDS